MIQPTFPRTRGNMPTETYLTLLLLALVEQAGGEMHLSAQSLESIDSGAKILVDWDSPSQKLIIRAGSPSLVVSEVKGAWQSTTQPQVQTAPANHRVVTEEDLIARIQKKVQDDQMKIWREQGAAAVAGMPGPE